MATTTTTNFGPQGWTPERLGSLAGKTFVITGTTTGTGLEATRVFLSKGARVVMLNRSAERGAATVAALKGEFGPDADVVNIHLDLAVLGSVHQAAAEVLEIAPQIDALVCNAAISQVAKQEITVDGFESHLGVNYYGHFVLSGLLFDRIDASEGRIVIVGSASYRMGLKRIKFEDLNFDEGYNAWNPYAHSKLAQMMFGYELQRRVTAAGRNVEVHVCHPGASRTDLLKGDNLNRVTTTIWAIVAPLLAQSAEKGSWPEVMCATEPGLKSETLYGPTRRSEMVGPVGECDLAAHALDQEDSVKLWKVSEENTSFTWPI